MKALIALRSKLFNPCRKLVQIFRFKLKRPVFIRALRVRTRSHHAQVRKVPKKSPSSALRSIFRFLRQAKSGKMDNFAEFRSFSEAGHDRLLFSSPITPAAYMRVGVPSKRESSGYGGMEDACRSFENHLVEMIVEEGNVNDLIDVEELLYCWKNLTCPAFIDLASRFYGELCTDLFSGDDDDDDDDNAEC